MTKRGAATRARLLQATGQVVSEVGYAHATTRAIAQAAGVAEGTIYRHFPNKLALFFTAALEQDGELLESLGSLPQRVGTGTVSENLTWAFTRLATLREQMLPLEMALLTDPELASMRAAMPPPQDVRVDPPQAITAYLQAEQELGRVRRDLDCPTTVHIMLATLFGLAALPAAAAGVDDRLVGQAVALFVDGLIP